MNNINGFSRGEGFEAIPEFLGVVGEFLIVFPGNSNGWHAGHFAAVEDQLRSAFQFYLDGTTAAAVGIQNRAAMYRDRHRDPGIVLLGSDGTAQDHEQEHKGSSGGEALVGHGLNLCDLTAAPYHKQGFRPRPAGGCGGTSLGYPSPKIPLENSDGNSVLLLAGPRRGALRIKSIEYAAIREIYMIHCVIFLVKTDSIC